MFGPVSGGHFNPVVSLVDASFGGLRWRTALVAQLVGGVVAVGILRVLYPDITPAEAAEAVFPDDDGVSRLSDQSRAPRP